MRLKVYDILSQLIPGFVLLLVIIEVTNLEFGKEFIIPSIALAFFVGYFINAVASWFEPILNFTWGGRPSNLLLKGKRIWKVPFYQIDKVRGLLLSESDNSKPSNNELFGIAMRYANHSDNERIQDFNAMYAFSRAIFMTVLISGVISGVKYFCYWQFYPISLFLLLVAWLRCKQRGGYYAREVLNTYLHLKTTSID